MIGKRKIDHLVYCVPNLEEAIQEIGSKLGIFPVFGGFHKTQGTKNALLNLGSGQYLEILAADPTNKEHQSNRWMGIDLIQKPQMTRWAIKSDNISSDSIILKSSYPKMGAIFNGSRLTSDGEELAWSMILPLSKPEVEVIPFMVDWSDSAFHPTDKLEIGCELKEISFKSQNQEKDIETFKKLGLENSISQALESKISVVISGPNGEVWL